MYISEDKIKEVNIDVVSYEKKKSSLTGKSYVKWIVGELDSPNVRGSSKTLPKAKKATEKVIKEILSKRGELSL